MSFNPEIVKGDPLYSTIVNLVERYKPKKIIEIGSANGLGSTQAFIEGLLKTGTDGVKMACIEAHPQRFKELEKNTAEHAFIHCINASSVPVDEYMSEQDIEQFMSKRGYSFNIVRYHSLETVKGWREAEIKTLNNHGIFGCGLECAQKLMGDKPEDVDMVLIDGSAFTGFAELTRVLGAKVILMDDTMDIKCYDAVLHLRRMDMYVPFVEDRTHRNGYAVYERAF